MKRKLIITLIFLVLLIIYLLLGNFFNIYIDCPIKSITNFYCPGCGITRMFYSILILDFYRAFRYNPLLFIMLPIFVFFIINSIVTKKEPLYNKIPKQILYTFIFILIIYGILRNVPLFDFLAPTFIG